MSGSSERARNITSVLSVVLASSMVLTACEQIDARNGNRKGNHLFHDAQFIDAAYEYEAALKKEDQPIIHYNLGQTYSKIFHPGAEQTVKIGVEGEAVCQLPGASAALVEASACVKDGDRHYPECGEQKTKPIEGEITKLKGELETTTDNDKKRDLLTEIKDKEDEVGRYTCASSSRCVTTKFCSLTNAQLVDLAAQHLQIWIKAQPSDEEIDGELKVAIAAVDAIKKTEAKAGLSEAQRKVDDLLLKDQTRQQMTSLWLESEQFSKAIDYWEGLLKERPTSTSIMNTLAGINRQSGDWRKSIEWYNKVADLTSDPDSKVEKLQFIGNLAWGRLNQRTLPGADAIELADRGIGALQKAAELQPKSLRLTSLIASLYNFRSTAPGSSWAAAIDRTSSADSRLLEPPAPPPAPGAATAPTAPAAGASAGAGSAAGSGSAAGTGSASAAGSAAGSAAAAPAAPATATAPSGSAAATPAATEPPAGSAAAAPAPPTPPTPPAPPASSSSTTPSSPATGGSAEKSGG